MGTDGRRDVAPALHGHDNVHMINRRKEGGREGGREGLEWLSLDLSLYQHPHAFAGLEEVGDVGHALEDVAGASLHEEEDVAGLVEPAEEGLREGVREGGREGGGEGM